MTDPSNEEIKAMVRTIDDHLEWLFLSGDADWFVIAGALRVLADETERGAEEIAREREEGLE